MKLRSSDDTGAVDYDVLGVSREAVANMFSMNSYFHNYGRCDADGPDLHQRQEEFRAFQHDAPFTSGTVKDLSCPEDIDCPNTSCKGCYSCCPHGKCPVCVWNAIVPRLMEIGGSGCHKLLSPVT